MADFWRKRGWQITIHPTQSPGHATELAKEAALGGCQLVLAAGGDGTLGEVANGLVGTDTILAPLPVGTANSFAKELGMPLPGFLDKQKLLEAAEVLANGRVFPMDLGYRHDEGGNGRYWLLWSGTGVDGYIVHQIEPRPRWSKKLGPLGYVMQSFKAMQQYPNIRAKINVDGRVFEDEYVLITLSNCRMYGGEVLLNPTGVLNDGIFEVWLFRGKGMHQLFQYAIETKFVKHIENEDVIMVQGREISVETDPIIGCHTDGDPAGHSPLVCEVKPGAIRMLVPSTTPTDMFVGAYDLLPS